MRIAINLGPNGDWPAILTAAQRADALGFDAVSFLDHYHAPKLEWSYLCGWSLYGALAMATSRIHRVDCMECPLASHRYIIFKDAILNIT